MYIQCYTKIPIDKLYEDYYFLRYVTGRCKVSLARILGMYQFPLPGGITVNADMMRDEGKEDMEWVLERIDAETQPDWFMQYHLSPLSIILSTSIFVPNLLPIIGLPFLGYIIWKNKGKISKIFNKIKNTMKTFLIG